VFLNKDEAIGIVSRMHGDFSLDNLNDEKFLLERLMELETKVVALTDGKRGAWVASGGEIIFSEGLMVAAVDSTGAGDAFLSGFLAAYVKEKSSEECLRWGIANSASVVEHYGAIEGLLPEEEILKKAKNIKTEIISRA
jgi:fructokinase